MKLNKILLALFILTLSFSAEAQLFKKLKKRVARSAEETVLRKAENKTAEKTNEAIDSVFAKPNNQPDAKTEKNNDGKEEMDNAAKGNDAIENDQEGSGANKKAATDPENAALVVYKKFDFVPGDKIIIYDDLSEDNPGDFPANWDTNGSAEIVTFNEDPQKWMSIVNRSVYIPDHDELPEECTIEFDVMPVGLNKKTSSTARLEVRIEENPGFKESSTRSDISIPFCQYSAPGFQVEKVTNGKRDFYNIIKKDVRTHVDKQAHISIAINKKRMRMWVNETKVVDIPRFLNEGKANKLKFYSQSFKDPEEAICITNLKISEGGLDLREKLLKDGRFSTTGILFDSGSATIKPESFGTLKMIATALKQENSAIKIIGHTDSDGADTFNLELSEKRAAAVKNAMVQQFDIDPASLTVEGQGEANPVADNSSREGKAQNRRVEFVKIN